MAQWQTQAFRELHTPVADVLGARTAKDLEKLRIRTVGDLLRHLPRRYLSGTELTDLATIEQGEHVAVMAKVSRTQVVHGGRNRPSRLEVTLTDGQGYLAVTFFGREHLVEYWQRELGKGVRGIFVGKVGQFRDQLQLTHPEFVMLDAAGAIVGSSEKKQLIATMSRTALVGMYPATAKLPTWKVAECCRLALATLSGADDPWPDWVLDAADLMPLADAFAAVHQPRSLAEAEAGAHRLRFDEAFATQLTMAYRRADASTHTAVRRPVRAGGLLDALDARLPFALTDGQRAVGDTLFAELDRPRPMQRLLQGEVGSGKTVVALRAMLAVVDAGGQCALLAPTEVLAQQHYATIRALMGDLAGGGLLGAPEGSTDVVLLTGSMPAAARREALLRAASGEAGIVVGTHALLNEKVQFADLGFVVIDEQHRFGVEQRGVLTDKASARPHVLVLTATPIPRSVAMTIFGDLDISTLAELPAGRQVIGTVVVDAARRPAWVERAWQRVAEEVAQHRQAFVVVPRINSSDEGTGVVDLADQLRAGPLAGVRVGVLHGQLAADAKESTMAAFAAGELDVLVATTVIEVGVDVPNATMMVIWDAERFGISQLHQLRGRIGRGEHPGVCLLVSSAVENDTIRERLDAVAATNDGFELAELDLIQRREGDVLGAEQSGARSSLRLLSVLEHADVIAQAKTIAGRAVERDPGRTTPGFVDAVLATEQLMSGDFLELS
ncbi:ATP-dependent DNA helicase RecG [Micropruina sonneratiae]|uniref:ATP-dependent DNA helicase RecG n=1 Tax=Micropruina sonneratiae TaxID=2986940 RepID=UPI0022272AE3|nr:ATP-dependent DNA helicase RecG [Micropruina sp. KQZ13P-5]MCW3157329.1 ATP-dependent DNA helicase RecG [Micropruina sp. KQZ13P-5]